MPESISTDSCYCDHKQVTSPFSTSGVFLSSMNVIRELRWLWGFNEVIHVSAHYLLIGIVTLLIQFQNELDQFWVKIKEFVQIFNTFLNIILMLGNIYYAFGDGKLPFIAFSVSLR